MSIVIEKGIPLPTRARGGFPFAEMEVGDSFFILGKKSIATKSAETKLGFKFKSKAVDGGCRVWRIT